MEKFQFKTKREKITFIFLILIILSISFVLAADNSGNLVPVTIPPATGTASTQTSGEQSSQTQNPLQQTIDSSQGVKWTTTAGGGERATFTSGTNQLKYNVGGKSYSLEGVKVPGGGFSPGYIEFDKSGKPVDASYQMGDKGSAQVFGKTEAYVPAGSNVDWKGQDAKVIIPETNEGVKGTPKTISSEVGVDVNVHYGITGKTQFNDDNGVKQFQLKKGDEIAHDGKNWLVEPGKTITPTTPNGETKIPVLEDKGAVKFYPNGIPSGEKGSAVAVGNDGKISLQGSALETSPKVEISNNANDRYTSLQAGKGSKIDFGFDTKTNLPVIKATGNSWIVTDGKIEYKWINGGVYIDTLKTPPQGMSNEEFSKIKGTQGLEIMPVDENGKSVFLDTKGNPDKIRINLNNPKGFDVVDINSVYDPRVSYGDNPPVPSGQVAQNQQIPSTKNNPYGFDLNKVPDYNKFLGPETSFVTKNFIVNAPNGNAKAYAAALEFWRYKNGVDVNGGGFPDWAKPTVVTINENPNIPTNGETRIRYIEGGGVDDGYESKVEGSLKRILDSTIPHEVNHMVFANEYKQPIPHGVDEGSAAYLEDNSQKSLLHSFLISGLQNGGSISFNDLFSMNSYPQDNNAMLMVYSEGLTMREYLELQKPGQFPGTIREAVNSGNSVSAWETAIRDHYGFQTLGQFQQSWNQWVGQNAAKWASSRNIRIAR